MNRLLLIIGVVLIPLVGTYSSAQDGPVELVTKGCKNEIETNCKNVTPGEGRVLAGLYAYGDKLSSGCE